MAWGVRQRAFHRKTCLSDRASYATSLKLEKPAHLETPDVSLHLKRCVSQNSTNGTLCKYRINKHSKSKKRDTGPSRSDLHHVSYHGEAYELSWMTMRTARYIANVPRGHYTSKSASPPATRWLPAVRARSMKQPTERRRFHTLFFREVPCTRANPPNPLRRR